MASGFIRIDFANMTVIGPKMTTPIVSMEKSAGQLLLQGTEMGYAWSLALTPGNGKPAATLVDRDEVAVFFGACMPL